jgi:ATP:ADP antiporter, AAA family
VSENVRQRADVRWSFALFFCVFAAWYAVRPVRDAMGIVGSVRDLPRLFLVTLVATLAVTPLFSALVSRLPRRRFVAVVYRAAALSLLIFAFLLRAPTPNVEVARVFFVWSSVLNLFLIALAWALMADVFSREDGIRFFAFIGGGGTLGAIAGSALASVAAGRASTPVCLVSAVFLLELAVRCASRTGVAVAAPERALPEGGIIRWLRTALLDRYFVGICLYLVSFTFSSTVLYLQQAGIVKAAELDTPARTLLFARIDLLANVLTFLLQVTVVGRSLRYVGIGAALALLPLYTLGCFALLHFAPYVGVLVACQVTRRALDFAFAKPAREVLFTVVEPANKYKTKSFIDTFIYRSGDAFAAVGFAGLPVGALATVMGAVCGVWAVVGIALGRWSAKG